jgi:hypothetical protein
MGAEVPLTTAPTHSLLSHSQSHNGRVESEKGSYSHSPPSHSTVTTQTQSILAPNNPITITLTDLQSPSLSLGDNAALADVFDGEWDAWDGSRVYVPSGNSGSRPNSANESTSPFQPSPAVDIVIEQPPMDEIDDIEDESPFAAKVMADAGADGMGMDVDEAVDEVQIVPPPPPVDEQDGYVMVDKVEERVSARGGGDVAAGDNAALAEVFDVEWDAWDGE